MPGPLRPAPARAAHTGHMTHRLAATIIAVLLAGCGLLPTPARDALDEGFVRPPAEGLLLGPTAPGPLTGRTIVVDPGHAGLYDRAVSAHPLDMGPAGTRPCYTDGATAPDGTPEHTLNFDVATRLATHLRDRGATVVLTRGDDASLGPCNDDRARLANAHGADLLVSLHFDGDSADKHGFHLIYAPTMVGGEALTERSRTVALALANALRAGTPLPPANYKGTPDAPLDPRTNLGVLSLLDTTPGALVELANLGSPDDWALVQDPATLDAAASALADGVVTALP